MGQSDVANTVSPENLRQVKCRQVSQRPSAEQTPCWGKARQGKGPSWRLRAEDVGKKNRDILQSWMVCLWLLRLLAAKCHRCLGRLHVHFFVQLRLESQQRRV